MMQEFYYVIQETFNPGCFMGNKSESTELQNACRFLERQEALKIANNSQKSLTVRKIKVFTKITLVSD